MIVQLSQDTWPQWVSYIKDTGQNPQLMDRALCRWMADRWFLAMEGEQIVGSIGALSTTLTVYGNPVKMIWQVNSFVREEWRGKGLATALYTELKTLAPMVGFAWGEPTAQLFHLAQKVGTIQAQCSLVRWAVPGMRSPKPFLERLTAIVYSDFIHAFTHPQGIYLTGRGAVWRREGDAVRILFAGRSIPENNVAWCDYYTSSPQDFSEQGFIRLRPEETDAYPHLLSPVDRRPQYNTFMLCSDTITGFKNEDCRFTRLDGGRDQPRGVNHG